jgi:hypothetical protein
LVGFFLTASATKNGHERNDEAKLNSRSSGIFRFVLKRGGKEMFSYFFILRSRAQSLEQCQSRVGCLKQKDGEGKEGVGL